MSEENNEIDARERRVYELGYLLLPTIAEEGIAGEATSLKDLILSFDALPIAEEYPKLVNLAYDMEMVLNNKKEHFATAYFGWFKFELDPEKLGALDAKLKLGGKLIRYLLIKTVRENTMASKRPFSRDFKRRVETPAVEINKEEIDKQIDALVEEEVAPTA